MPGTMEESVFFQGVNKKSAAFRLMKQMGWKEGAGLGKNKQGIKQHLRVKKKDDTAGVGANELHNWTYNTTDFDNLLKNLKVQVGHTVPKNSIDEDEEDEDEEDVKSEELKIKKVCRPQGRYKRMERGKLVHNYSQADLQSILGNSSLTLKEEKTVSYVDLNTQTDEDADEKTCFDYEVECNESTMADWWGIKYGFVKGGMLGASSKVTNKSGETSIRRSFSENDQEQLYKSVENKASTGRGGLGIGDRPKKIGGARWKGQKMAFDDTDEQNQKQVVEMQEIESKETDSKVEKKRKKGQSNDGEAKVKWKKLCKDFLLQAPEQKSSLRKLQRHISAAVGPDVFSDIDSFRSKLLKSPRFLIEGNKIFLAPQVPCET